MSRYTLAIDQGTTSSRAIVFDDALKIVSVAQQEFTEHYPHSGWVEHDPAELLDSVVDTCRPAARPLFLGDQGGMAA
jgi:glycerol kinase